MEYPARAYPHEDPMCDDDSLDDMLEYQRRSPDLSRRRLGSLAVGAGLASLLPGLGCATDPKVPAATGPSGVSESEVAIQTPDGSCDAYFVHPAEGAHAAVLIWPDIFGLRPAFRQMGKRLAEAGYSVLVINPFYRKQKAPTAPEHPDFNDPATRAALMALSGSLSAQTALTDATAFVAWLDAQAAVDRKRKMGTTGYCMGGPLVFRTAAAFPDRIGAAASFHGGGLVSDKPDSPHLSIPQMKAQFLVAIAANDDARQPEAKDVLKAAFAKVPLHAEVEVYAGAQHGWCPPDSRAYDHDAAEKAWARQQVLFKAALG
jgi:carboxymethylenebutenolidase